MHNLVLSPDGLLAACTDDKGRVVLVDSVSKTILRSWKGYRDAQVGWVRHPGTAVGRGKGCTEVLSDGSQMKYEGTDRCSSAQAEQLLNHHSLFTTFKTRDGLCAGMGV